MKTSLVTLVYICFVGLLLSVSSEAFAYVFIRGNNSDNPYRLRDDYPFPDAPRPLGHKFYIDGCTIIAGGRTVRDIELAVLEWNAVRGMRDMIRLMGHRPCGHRALRKDSVIKLADLRGISGDASFRRTNFETREITRVRIRIGDHIGWSDSYPTSCTSENTVNRQSVTLHELGHALNLEHNNYSERHSIMQSVGDDVGVERAKYCGTSNYFQPHPDDVGGGRYLYPSSLENDDVAPVAWIPDLRGPRRAEPVAQLPACPGDEVTQEFLISNRGTRLASYDRHWYLSGDNMLGWDAHILTEYARYKRSGAQYGTWWSQIELTLPVFPDPGEQNRIIVSFSNANQSREFDEKNDWTYFPIGYSLAEVCP